MIKLTITEKGGEPRALSFDQNEVSIGRVQGNDIVLPKGNISKRHSKLTVVEGRLNVIDSKSTNGTYVNGRKIADVTPLRPGDKIFVGDFLIVIDPAAAASETSSSGSRRGPPPPPPPPPRPGLSPRAASLAEAESGDDDDVGLGALGSFPERAAPGGRSFPPAPPPPPPRPTIMTTALQDDSVDIGADEPPPSLDDVSSDGGLGARDEGIDSLPPSRFSPLGNSDDNEETGAPDPDDALGTARHAAPGSGPSGNDVFGYQPAPDEDARARGDAHPAAPHLPLRSLTSTSDVAATGGGSSSSSSAVRAMGIPEVTGAGGPTLETLLAEASVTSIVINAGGSVHVERAGKLEPAGSVGDGNTLAETVWQWANTAVPPPPADNPVVDVRLPDGTRVTALFPPIASASVSAIIRKSPTPEIAIGEIAGSGDVESILTAAIASRRNLVLCGDPAAVAVLASSLGASVPSERRVVSIGPGPATHPAWIELTLGGDLPGLVRAALAFRADHLLVSDAGGAEWPELLLAAARGQEGVIGAMAARSTSEALSRLRAFCVEAIGSAALPSLVASTIDLVVLAGTTAAGTVRVLEIAEPNPEGEALAPTLVARRPEKNRTTTTLDVTGVSPRLAAAMAVSADALPSHLVRR